MKRLRVLPRVLPALLIAALAVPVTVAPPAHAKGATHVVVSGPGIGDVRLGWTRRMDDVDVGSLAEVSGIYLILGAGIATDDPGLTKAELGPRYELTWYAGSTVLAVSHVYPFTTQSAWMRIPHEQGGWVRGGPALERAMVELGAVRPGDGAKAGVSTSSTTVGPSSAAMGSDSSASSPAGAEQVAPSPSVPVAGVAGLATLALLMVAAAVWMVRRRRTPQPA
ncbi:MAG: hypothetical protein ACRDO4_07385 [Nocardioides sp.]